MFSASARILIVAASAETRQHLASQLADIGFRNVTAVADDTAAWKAMEAAPAGKQAFHILFSDWETAYGKAGLLARVRGHQPLKTMAVMVMLPPGTTQAPAHDTHLTVQALLQCPTRLADLVRSLKHTDSEKTAA